MRSLTLSIAFLCLLSIPWSFVYAKTGDESFSSHQILEDGSVIAVGHIGQAGHINDYWIIKIDKNGQKEWEKTYGGDKNDEAREILAAQDNHFYVTGFSFSKFKDEPAFWIIKIDSNGEMIWEKSFKGMKFSFDGRVQVTKDDGLMVILDKKEGNSENSSLWITKLSKEGELQWEKVLKAEYDPAEYPEINEELHDFYQTRNDEYILLSSTDMLGKDRRAYYDVRCAKLDHEGKIIWSKSYSLNRIKGTYFNGYSVIPAHDNGYIISSRLWSQEYDVDIRFTKIDEDGNIVWDKIHNSTGKQDLKNIQQIEGKKYIFSVMTGEEYRIAVMDKNGNAVWHYEFTDIKPNWDPVIFSEENSYYVFGIPISKERKKDLKIYRINPDKKVIWSRTFDRYYYNIVSTIKKQGPDLYLSGYVMNEEYDMDGWILKVNNKGKTVWENKIGSKAIPQKKEEKEEKIPEFNVSIKKIDEKGDLSWSKEYGTATFKSYLSLWPLRNNNCVIIKSTFGKDILKDHILKITKVDDKGKTIWEKIYKNIIFIPSALLSLKNNEYLLAGSKIEKAKGESKYEFKLRLIKINNKGKITWKKDINRSLTPGNSRAVCLDREESIFIFNISDPLTFARTQIPSKEKFDIIKINKDGRIVWEKTHKCKPFMVMTYNSVQITEDGFLLRFYRMGEDLVFWDTSVFKLDNKGDREWNYEYPGILWDIKQTKTKEYVCLGHPADRYEYSFLWDEARDKGLEAVKLNNKGEEFESPLLKTTDFFGARVIDIHRKGDYLIAGKSSDYDPEKEKKSIIRSKIWRIKINDMGKVLKKDSYEAKPLFNIYPIKKPGNNGCFFIGSTIEGIINKTPEFIIINMDGEYNIKKSDLSIINKNNNAMFEIFSEFDKMFKPTQDGGLVAIEIK
ncbi:MAG: hypothetical protein JW827_00720 [Spirochaetes bacterium]|nr:hypothetical protein [Spirochaetota bacterium]